MFAEHLVFGCDILHLSLSESTDTETLPWILKPWRNIDYVCADVLTKVCFNHFNSRSAKKHVKSLHSEITILSTMQWGKNHIKFLADFSTLFLFCPFSISNLHKVHLHLLHWQLKVGFVVVTAGLTGLWGKDRSLGDQRWSGAQGSGSCETQSL